MKQEYKSMLLISGLILLAAITRLFDHPANFSPIMAISIFSGAYFADKKLAFLIPISAMLFSDLFLGFYTISFFVYGSFLIGILIGRMMQNRVKFSNIALSLLSGSIVFFIITNFGAWLTDPMYQPLTFESLQRCYYMAIPFFRNSLIGNFVYGAILFGAYNLSIRYIPALNK